MDANLRARRWSSHVAVLLAAWLAWVGIARLGEHRLAADELPGERWNGAIDRGPAFTAPPASGGTTFEPLGEAQTLAALSTIRAARGRIHPCEARIQVDLLQAGRSDDGNGPTFRVEAASADAWKVAHEADEGSFVATDGASRLLSRVGWSAGGFSVSPSSMNDGGPLSLPSWILEPEYVVGVDPTGTRMRFEVNGHSGELIVATFDVEIASGRIQELVATLMPADRRAAHPVHVRQRLLDYKRLECPSAELVPFDPRRPVEYLPIPARADVALGPPLGGPR